MGASSTTLLDFGSHPGAYQANVAVTGQASIIAGSLVEAWLYPVATADHSVDEQLLDSVRRWSWWQPISAPEQALPSMAKSTSATRRSTANITLRGCGIDHSANRRRQ